MRKRPGHKGYAEAIWRHLTCENKKHESYVTINIFLGLDNIKNLSLKSS